MSKTAGLLVQFTKKDGSIQKGIVRHSEQTEETKKLKKNKVLLIHKNFRPVKEMKGKKEVNVYQLVSQNKCQVIGYTD